MKKNILLLLVVVKLLSSCKSDSRFPDMELMDNGYYFSLLKSDNGGKTIEIGDVVFLKQVMMTEKDSIIFDSRTMMKQGEPPYAVKIAAPAYKGDMFEALLNMKIGDSAAFALRVDSMFALYYKQAAPDFLKGTEYIKYYLKIDSSYSKEKVSKIEAEREKMQMEYMNSLKSKEDSIIKDYVVKNKVLVKPTETGLYITELKKGKGSKIQKGDSVTVNYSGKFFDGTVFDESKNHPDAFTFPAGEGRVIPGWDEALLTMSEGGKVNLIIPSSLAYGPQGMENNIPPYATLFFEMEVVKVKPLKK